MGKLRTLRQKRRDLRIVRREIDKEAIAEIVNDERRRANFWRIIAIAAVLTALVAIWL